MSENTNPNNKNSGTNTDRTADDAGLSPADAALQRENDQKAQDLKDKEAHDKELAKDGPQGPEVNTPNLSASVYDGHDLSQPGDGEEVLGANADSDTNAPVKAPKRSPVDVGGAE